MLGLYPNSTLYATLTLQPSRQLILAQLHTGSGISSVEPSGSASRQLISKMYTAELSVQYGGGWNWLRIVTVAGSGISSVEPSGSASRVCYLVSWT